MTIRMTLRAGVRSGSGVLVCKNVKSRKNRTALLKYFEAMTARVDFVFRYGDAC